MVVRPPFEEALSLTPDEAGRLHARATPDWGQGRSTFGGLQAAWCVRAMRALVAPERALRTLSLHFAGPLPADADAVCAARIERAGGSVTQASARLTIGDAPVVLALATFASPRAHALACPPPPPPTLRAPRPVRFPLLPGVPVFLQHVDLDLVEGMPYAGAAIGRVSGWARFAVPTPLDEAALVALADVSPPAVAALLSGPRPSSTVDMRVDVLAPLPLADAPAHPFVGFRFVVGAAGDGVAVEHGALWLEDGRPLATMQQLRAVY